jgi:hypothetical protein
MNDLATKSRLGATSATNMLSEISSKTMTSTAVVSESPSVDNLGPAAEKIIPEIAINNNTTRHLKIRKLSPDNCCKTLLGSPKAAKLCLRHTQYRNKTQPTKGRKPNKINMYGSSNRKAPIQVVKERIKIYFNNNSNSIPIRAKPKGNT